MRFTIMLLFSCSLIESQVSEKGRHWIQLKTNRFELYSGASERVARDTITRLEQVDAFLSKLPEFRPKSDAPVRVVIFNTAEQFAPYRATDWEMAHYEPNGVRDWIALGPVYDPHTVAHELTHLTVHRAGMDLPHWLSEGLADLFSTATFAGSSVTVGSPPQSRMDALAAGKWMDIQTVLALDDKKYESMSGADAALFYPPSWAITHMLYMSPEYAQDFSKLLQALDHSKSSGDVLQRMYHKTPEAIYVDLKRYIARPRLNEKVFSQPGMGREPASRAVVTATPVSSFVSDLILADLLDVMGNKAKKQEARLAFDRINRTYRVEDQIGALEADDGPGVAAMYVQLGLVGHEDEPNPALLGIIDRITRLPQIQQPRAGSSTATLAEMYFQIGIAKASARQPPDKVAESFARCVSLKPDYAVAHQQLIRTFRKAKEYKKAMEAVNGAVAALPGMLEFNMTRGHIYVEMEDFPAAIREYGGIPADSGYASDVVNGFMGIAASYREAGSLDSAMDVALRAGPWVHSAFDSDRVGNMLVFAGQSKALGMLRAGSLQEARKAVASYRKFASSSADSAEVERIEALISARGKGRYAARKGEKTEHAEGTAQALECSAAGSLLRVMVGKREMKFDLPDAALVEVTAAEVRSIGARQVNITCGRLEPFHIVIDYSPPGVASKTSAGIVRQMAF